MRGRERARRLLVTLTGGRTRIRVHPSASFLVSKDAKLLSGNIVIGRDSSVTIEAGVIIDSDLTIGDNCTVVFSKDSRLVNTSFGVTNGSIVHIGEGAIINSAGTTQSAEYNDNEKYNLEIHRTIKSTS